MAVLLCVYGEDDPCLYRDALQSIADQDISSHNLRIYLGIDGEVPQAIEAANDEFASLIHKIHRNERNIGLARTLNILIQMLEDEEFVFRADADDISEPNRFRVQVAHLVEHPEIALIGAQACDIDTEGRPLGDRNFPTDHDAIVRSLAYMNPILHPSYAMRRKLFDDPGIRYRPFHLCEDLDFVMRLALAGHRLGNSPARLLKFRVAGAFFARRISLSRGLVELRLYSGYILATRGPFSPAYAFAFCRLLMRIIPRSWANRLYRSSLRHRLLRIEEKAPARE
ncbi:glycosyltransferase [Stappia sp. GBMRC 2046]|uniref:Glycosyltransferase n=1 Tax=Stappia sediminis TaxID=2692190 RepID=A0A7X3LY34_9HYPH|nr:glycosyltransferase [Stappia sediminis]MXN67220.1 glycosyltransferase [Stappia sediminis]